MSSKFGKPNGIHTHHRVSSDSSKVHETNPCIYIGTGYYTDWNGQRRKHSIVRPCGVSNKANDVNWEDEWETNYYKSKVGNYGSKL